MQVLVGPQKIVCQVLSESTNTIWRPLFTSHCPVSYALFIVKILNEREVKTLRRSETGEAMISTIQPWHRVWERLPDDPHSLPLPCYSQRRFAPRWVLDSTRAEEQIPVSASGFRPRGSAGTRGCGAGLSRAGPVGSRPASPPRLPAAQSGRGSGVICDQSGTAGTVPGVLGRRASSDSRAGRGAARSAATAAQRTGSLGPAQLALPRRPSSRRSGNSGPRLR